MKLHSAQAWRISRSSRSRTSSVFNWIYMYRLAWRYIWSTVRLRFRKSISGHHFQTIRKLANTDFQYRRGIIYSIYQYILTKNVFFARERNCTFIYGPFSCLIIVLFGSIFMEELVFFSYARSILELMCCSLNLTKLDILNLVSSDCRAWDLKLSEYLKKGQNMFLSSFCQLQLNVIFSALFQYLFVQNISYPKSLIKVIKNLIFQKSLTSHETNLTLLFFLLACFTRNNQNQSGLLK